MTQQTDLNVEVTVKNALEDYYRDGPPWDTGTTPPELIDLIEGDGAPRPGRALELGCGTGTNAIYLAQRGWEVTGVDLIGRAIEQAEAKVAAAGVAVELRHGDVTRLDEIDAGGEFDLFFDLSCYCGIPTHRRDAYAAGLTKRAKPGACLLMFGYGPGVLDEDFSGVTEQELRSRFGDWGLVDVTPGTNPFPTFWFTLRRKG